MKNNNNNNNNTNNTSGGGGSANTALRHQQATFTGDLATVARKTVVLTHSSPTQSTNNFKSFAADEYQTSAHAPLPQFNINSPRIAMADNLASQPILFKRTPAGTSTTAKNSSHDSSSSPSKLFGFNASDSNNANSSSANHTSAAVAAAAALKPKKKLFLQPIQIDDIHTLYKPSSTRKHVIYAAKSPLFNDDTSTPQNSNNTTNPTNSMTPMSSSHMNAPPPTTINAHFILTHRKQHRKSQSSAALPLSPPSTGTLHFFKRLDSSDNLTPANKAKQQQSSQLYLGPSNRTLHYQNQQTPLKVQNSSNAVSPMKQSTNKNGKSGLVSSSSDSSQSSFFKQQMHMTESTPTSAVTTTTTTVDAPNNNHATTSANQAYFGSIASSNPQLSGAANSDHNKQLIMSTSSPAVRKYILQSTSPLSASSSTTSTSSRLDTKRQSLSKITTSDETKKNPSDNQNTKQQLFSFVTQIKRTKDTSVTISPRETTTTTTTTSTAITNRDQSNIQSASKQLHPDWPYYIGPLLKALKSPQPNDAFSKLVREHFIQTCQGVVFSNFAKAANSTDLMAKKVTLGTRNPKFRKTIVFDLDETLIHCNTNALIASDFTVDLHFPTGEFIQAGINVRPFAEEILRVLSKEFEIVVFTASHSVYAQSVIDRLDPERKHVHHRYFREHCIQSASGVYMKDLRVFSDRKLSEMVLVDNAAYSFCFQVDNGIPIIPFYDDKNDSELKHLMSYLTQLNGVSDVREYNRQHLKMNLFNSHQGPKKVQQDLFKQF